MPNHAAPHPSRLAAFRADESGAIRTDVVVGGLAVVALLGILVMSDMNSADPVFGEGDPAAEAAAAPARTVSAVGLRAPEPEPLPDGAERRSYASPGLRDRFTSNPDNEQARLEAETEAARAAEAAARAAEAAAGGPPPLDESTPVAEEAPATGETPAADEALAAGEGGQEPPAGDGG
jgi:hypothetical protein